MPELSEVEMGQLPVLDPPAATVKGELKAFEPVVPALGAEERFAQK